ncbi:MAG: citrate transporter [Clostridiales bacterium]|jgi:Na+/H+ antiporter NhaC|nr:citrate transporter [Clostridiales bacterium]
MATVQALGIFILFAVCVALMMLRKLPTILALPIMAVGIAIVSGMPFMSSVAEDYTIAKNVLEAGSMRMSTAIAGLLFGGWFGKILTKVGVTRTIIRKAAELAGDRPLPISLAFLVVCSVIFAAANGLGMIILVGTIIIPIMISAGVEPLVAGTVLLLSNGIGVTFSVSTLGVYIDTLGLPLETVTSYSWLCGIPLIIVAVAMLVYFISKGGKTRKAWAMPAAGDGRNSGEKNVRSIALISPLIPIILVFAVKMPLVPAIMAGIVITLILSTPKNVVQVVSSAFVEGIQETAGACALMIGIGMVLNAVMAPTVSEVLNPVISAIIPNSPIMFVLVFGLLSFLAIYRGPLNVWGLGSGIVALLAASGMNPIAAMVALRLDSNVQAVCDPTNSHNVWVSDFTKIDVNDFLKKPILWVMASTIVGLTVASFIVL